MAIVPRPFVNRVTVIHASNSTLWVEFLDSESLLSAAVDNSANVELSMVLQSAVKVKMHRKLAAKLNVLQK